MRTLQASLVVAFVAASLAVACGKVVAPATVDGSTAGRCTPGESSACVGSGACMGSQVCNTSGTFEPCVCGFTPDASTGVPGAPVGVPEALAFDAFVTTVAGTGIPGSANGSGSVATFAFPNGVAVDGAGNLYVSDTDNNLVREITPATVNAPTTVITFAGTGSAGSANGSGNVATFDHLLGIAADVAGNVFVSDSQNDLIREVTPADQVTTLAGTGSAGSANGSASAATFSFPLGIAVDANDNVYVVDRDNNLIREVTSAGEVSTFAGTGAVGSANGSGSAASFSEPFGIAVDAAGNVYVADTGNQLIRKVTPAGVVTTLAGTGAAGSANGAATAATFDEPIGVGVDANGNVYVGDFGNELIREITPAGEVSTLAGTGAAGNANGSPSVATFGGPEGVAVDGEGNVFVATPEGAEVRKIAPGVGQLAVAWSPPSETGTSAITSYTATATAPGQPTKKCVVNAYTCTIGYLTSGVPYGVSVTATNGAGEGPPSIAVVAIPN
jgi:sugar lactone lactonase YvrE